MPEAEIDQGTLIENRYRIERVIGQGGFWRTYLASDEQRFGELCVLKEFLPSSRAEYIVQESRVLFEIEAKFLYQINHPQIPKFLACFAQMGRLFIVQEYIDGKTYSHLLRERRRLQQLFSEAEVIQWLRDLLPVLTYLHDRNIFHRDISPDSIMLPNHQSQPVLINFGLVKQNVTQIWDVNPVTASSADKSFVGKYGYTPFEQIRMGQCYPCSDLYALGVTAIVLLTGIEPDLLMDQNLEWQWHDHVKVSDHLTEILNKMLKEKPKDRYQSAQELLAALQVHTSIGVIAIPMPQMELYIEIDQDRKERQIAEIEEMDFFQELQRQSEELRNSVEDTALPELEPTPRLPQPPVFKLIHSSGREFPFQGEECCIGRGRQTIMNMQKIDVTGIPDEIVVSRSHARIFWNWSENVYMLVDNNSQNGTWLKGDPLSPGIQYRLNHGDLLQLGQNNLVCFTVSVTWLEAKPQGALLIKEEAVTPSVAVKPENQPKQATPPNIKSG